MTKPLIALFASIILFFSCATKSAIIGEKVDSFDKDKVSEIANEQTREYPDSTQLSIALLDSGMAHFVGLLRMDDTLVSVDNADQNFEIGSISKVFTSTLLASMVVGGEIDLDAPISRYIEVSSELEHEITLRSLANHTSGLPRLPSNLLVSGFDPNNPYGSYDEENIKEFFAEQVTTQTAPGEKYDYSNIGAGALGFLLTKASGSSYEELLKTKICKKAIPIIIIIAAMMILFLDKPVWRAISTTTIAMMIVIVLVDNNANARLEAYHDQLEIAANDLNIK